jgi:hypothetical protein
VGWFVLRTRRSQVRVLQGAPFDSPNRAFPVAALAHGEPLSRPVPSERSESRGRARQITNLQPRVFVLEPAVNNPVPELPVDAVPPERAFTKTSQFRFSYALLQS